VRNSNKEHILVTVSVVSSFNGIPFVFVPLTLAPMVTWCSRGEKKAIQAAGHRIRKVG